MSHQLFDITLNSALSAEDRRLADHLRDDLAYARGLGLEEQARAIESLLTAAERGGLVSTPHMDQTEERIWKGWLPIAYSDAVQRWEKYHLANYDLGAIPNEVLAAWQRHRERETFERFEIWTSRMPQSDQLLVGVNGSAQHPLARWCEPDCVLPSLEDIKQGLELRWRSYQKVDSSEPDIRWGINAFISLVSGGFVFAFAFAVICATCYVLGMDGTYALPTGVLIGVTCGIAIVIQVFRGMARDQWEASEIKQAIDQCDSLRREPVFAAA